MECVDGWFTASPGLSQTDRTLAGWGCTPVVQSNHGTQDKPAINTHTQEREPLSWQLVPLARQIPLAISNKYAVQ